MKTLIKNINLKLLLLLPLVAMVFACSSEFNQNDLDQGNPEPPVITSVASVDSNEIVGTGVLGGVYYIRGENLSTTSKITYNGQEALFNPVYVTENLIISDVPQDAPYIGQSNKLVVETAYGTAEYDFSLLTIEDFEESVQDGVSTVILNGGDFSNTEKVLFVSGTEELGNRVEREATILSQEEDQLTVVVPDNVVQAFIYVFVNGTAAVSSSYGFNYPIFTDELIDWEIGGWDGEQNVSDELALGASSIKRLSNPWAGLTFLPTEEAEDLVIADYSTISFQIYPANDATIRLAVALNDFTSNIVQIELTPGEWNKFVMPMTDFYDQGTAPETITRIDFQEFSGGGGSGFPYSFYFDQFGFIE